MSYTPNTWAKGDVVTSAKLNHMEDGIANSILVVTVDPDTAISNASYNDLKNAMFAILYREYEGEEIRGYAVLSELYYDDSDQRYVAHFQEKDELVELISDSLSEPMYVDDGGGGDAPQS